MDNLINKIHNKDCLDFMKEMSDNSIDMVLTSPPYNTARSVKTKRGLKNLENRYVGYNDNKTDEEYIEWTINILSEAERILVENGCMLYNLSYSSENTHLMWLVVAEIIKRTNLTIADCVVWKKKSALPNNVSHNKLTRIIEYVFVICRKSEISTFKTNKKMTGEGVTGQKFYENIFNFVEAANNDGATKTHKATYSTELCEKLLNIYAPENAIVLDPFIGTGTTAIACRNLNKRFIGIEISKEYCEIANSKLGQKIIEVVAGEKIKKGQSVSIENNIATPLPLSW